MLTVPILDKNQVHIPGEVAFVALISSLVCHRTNSGTQKEPGALAMKADTTKSSIVQDHDETNTPKRLVIWHNALGSAAAGVISRLFTHPLDTVRL